MAKNLLAICLMFIVASSVVYEVQGHFLLKLYLRRRLVPRTCIAFTPFACKGMLMLISNLEGGCPATREFKNFFSSFKAYISFLNSVSVSSSSNIDTELNGKAKSLFESCEVLNAIRGRKSSSVSSFQTTMLSMGKILIEQKRSGSRIMSFRQRKQLIIAMVQWTRMLLTFVKTASEQRGKSIDISSYGLDVDVNQSVGSSGSSSSSEDESTPTNSGSTPTPSGSTPTPSGSSPTPSGSTPTPSGSTPTPSGSTQTPSGSSPTPSGNTPTNSGSSPTPSGSTPTPSGSTPTSSGSSPTTSGSSPTSSGSVDQSESATKTKTGSKTKESSGSETSTKSNSGAAYSDATGGKSGSPSGSPSDSASASDSQTKKSGSDASTYTDTTGTKSASPSGSPTPKSSGSSQTTGDSSTATASESASGKTYSDTTGTKAVSPTTSSSGSENQSTGSGTASAESKESKSGSQTSSTSVKQVETETSSEVMSFISSLEKKYTGNAELKVFFDKLKTSMSASSKISSTNAQDLVSTMRSAAGKLSEAMMFVRSRFSKSAETKTSMETYQEQVMNSVKELQEINSEIASAKAVTTTQKTELKQTITKWEQVTTQFVETAASSSQSSSSSQQNSSAYKESSGSSQKQQTSAMNAQAS